jgi:hypothetical protein
MIRNVNLIDIHRLAQFDDATLRRMADDPALIHEIDELERLRVEHAQVGTAQAKEVYRRLEEIEELEAAGLIDRADPRVKEALRLRDELLNSEPAPFPWGKLSELQQKRELWQAELARRERYAADVAAGSIRKRP